LTIKTPYANNYFPFGSVMDDRSYNNEKYRFGFNGKEKEDGMDGVYAFEARIFDARIARWFSTDPREGEYAWQSTYAYYGNSPISTLDYLGKGAIAPPNDEADALPNAGITGQKALAETAGSPPQWYSNNSGKNRRQLKKFRRHLDKADKVQMDLIQGMPMGVAKTNAVDAFVETLNQTYSRKKWNYRQYTQSNNGEIVITQMSQIWAYKIDPRPSRAIPPPIPPAAVPLRWPLAAIPPGFPTATAASTNTTGRIVNVQITLTINAAALPGAIVNSQMNVSVVNGVGVARNPLNTIVNPGGVPFTSAAFAVQPGEVWSLATMQVLAFLWVLRKYSQHLLEDLE